MMRHLLTLGTLLWSATAVGAPGDHVRIGDTTIVPYTDLGYEYRSNPAQLESNVVSGSAMVLVPGMTIETSTSDMQWDLGFEYRARKYLSKRLVQYDRFSDFNFNTKLDLLRGRMVGLRLSEAIGMYGDPNASFSSIGPYNSQLRNVVGLGVVFRAGPALEIVPGMEWEFNDYFAPGTQYAQESINVRQVLRPKLDVRWDFFPRTALVLNSSVDVNQWDKGSYDTTNTTNGPPIAPTIALPNSLFVKNLVGLRGRFTERLVLVTMMGYGYGSYGKGEANPSVTQSVLGVVQVRYAMSDRHKLSVGYTKDFIDTFFTNYVAYNYVYGRLENRFGQRLLNSAEFGGQLEAYSGTVSRSDVVLHAKEDLSFEFGDYAALTTGVWWKERASSEASVQYDDVNVHFTVNVKY